MESASKWNTPRYVSLIAATYVFVGGLISLSGWALHRVRLTDWWGNGITIKANASIACVAAGAALLIATLRPSARILIRVPALVAAGIGGLTLLEHLSGIDLHIDTLLFDEPLGAAGTAAPGRMGPPASTSFLLLGLSLAFMNDSTRARRATVVLPIVILGVGTLALTGYWYGAAQMYTIPRLTGIATHTATFIVALSIGVLAAQPGREPTKTLCEESSAGVLARRLALAAFAVPLALGWLRGFGEQEQMYDRAFGSALRTLVEIAILGTLVWWTVQAVRMRDQQERRAETERRSGEQRLRSVLDASAVAFTVLAPVKDVSGAVVDFRWTYLNPAAAEILKRAPTQLIGKRISDILPDVWAESDMFEQFVAVTLGREVRDFELQSRIAGIEGWFQVVASPLDENVAVWYADVTERKRQEIELRNSDRRKDEFLATLAHELRNPLAPIRQAAVLAKRTTVSDAQRQWCHDVIERQVQHMSMLLDDLLDISRITRGVLELRKQPTALAALVESAIETARPLIDGKRHMLRVDLPNDAVELDIDPLRMSQVVANLLTNAAKYTNAGGIIRLSATLVGSDLVLALTDNGIGLEKHEIESIFNMFSQVKSAQERSEGGLGIGLALTKGLVELHGGRIEAYSAGYGLGSTFAVTIPNARIECAPLNLQPAATNIATPRRRILLADDNHDSAESLAMLLRSDGHEPILARDGGEALAIFEASDPDVVLLDIGMPKLSGYEVAKRIRALGSTATLVAITGWGQASDRAKSAHAGFDYHLTKPVDYRVLTDILAASNSHTRGMNSAAEMEHA